MKKLVLIVAVVIVAIAAAPLSAADGKALFEAKCATCHAKDGTGSTPMGKKFGLKDLGSKEVQALTDQQLIDITTNGKGKMPAYATKLSADEIKAVVAYIRTMK